MHPQPRTKTSPGYFGFKVIGAIKFASGLLMFVVGSGLLRLIDHNQGEGWERLIQRLQLDAHGRIFRSAVAAISGLDHAHLNLILAGIFFYAVLHSIEGIGLMLERDWAGYLVVIMTGTLLPFEVYEIARRPNALRIGVLLGNLAILIYLVVILVRERRERTWSAGHA